MDKPTCEGAPCPVCSFPYNPEHICARCFAMKLEKKQSVDPWDKLIYILEGVAFVISPQAIYDNAVAHGWHEQPRPVPEILALIHSEVSEALEAYRHNIPVGEKGWIGEELADIVIRVFDAAVELDIDIIREIIKKHEYNKTRPYRHGNKKA